MKIVYGVNNIKKSKRPVVALGVFDGVHKGHRYILEQTIKKARDIKGTSVVVTFDPHPRREQSLYSLVHRLRLINELGIDICIVIKFTPVFSRIMAVDFVKRILIGKIGAKFIFVGKNFKFGKSASGDYSLLKRLSEECDFEAKEFDMIKTGHKIISSTSIRRLIKEGNLDAARKLLQRPVSVFGTVTKGIRLAQKLGNPTANIDPHHEIIPPSGVYAVKVIFNKKVFDGVCNIGERPTILTKSDELGPGIQKQIEVYIFDFNRNIYGKDLEIQFIRKIRDEKKFTSIGSLAEQIKKDINSAKKIFYPSTAP